MNSIWLSALDGADLLASKLQLFLHNAVMETLRMRPDQDQARAWLAHSLTDRCVGSVRCHGDLGRPSVPMLVG
jgi:hypothetical protein